MIWDCKQPTWCSFTSSIEFERVWRQNLKERPEVSVMLEVTKGNVVHVSLNDLGQCLPAHGAHLVHPDVGPLQGLLDHLDPCFYATMCRVILCKTSFKINTSLSGQDTITTLVYIL